VHTILVLVFFFFFLWREKNKANNLINLFLIQNLNKPMVKTITQKTKGKAKERPKD
jgi:hypothetical protein